jgi:hypothetical protein
MREKPAPGAEQQDVKIRPCNAETTAKLWLVFFVEEDGLEELAIENRHLGEYLPDHHMGFAGLETAEVAAETCRRPGLVPFTHRDDFFLLPAHLPRHVGTQRIDERPKPLRMAHAAAGAHDLEHAGESLLRSILNQVLRTKAPAQPAFDQWREIREEMEFGFGIALMQSLQVTAGELIETGWAWGSHLLTSKLGGIYPEKRQPRESSATSLQKNAKNR